MDVMLPTPPGSRPTIYRHVDWAQRIVSQLETAPGLERAAVTSRIPLTESSTTTLARGRGDNPVDEERWQGVHHSVGDAYFDVMGLRLIDGRGFDAGDRFSEAQLISGPADQGVAIVSQSTAQRLWPGRSAVGKALWLPDYDSARWRAVVGVVEDMQFHAVGEQPDLHLFVPWSQSPSGRPRLVVGGPGRAASHLATVRDVLERVEPGTFITRATPLDTLVTRATAQPRFTSRLVAAFGALALLLAAIGIYGTLSYLVSARTREIGIRLALGAPRRRIVSHVLWSGLAPAVLGGVVGLAAAVALARMFQTLLFEVEPRDIGSFTAGAALLLLVALAAALGPARRAARVDPAVALRAE